MFHALYRTDEGYKQVYGPRNPYAKDDGYAPEHIIIAEETRGRSLAPNEVVHHKDGDKRNNNPKNLKIMDREEHRKMHNKERQKHK